MTEDELTAFWNLAREHANLDVLPAYFGPSPLGSLPPPTWCYSEDPGEADRFVAGLLDGSRLETSCPASEYGDELPEVGTLGIVTDGAGAPQVLVVTSEVEVLAAGVVIERYAVLYRR